MNELLTREAVQRQALESQFALMVQELTDLQAYRLMQIIGTVDPTGIPLKKLEEAFDLVLRTVTQNRNSTEWNKPTPPDDTPRRRTDLEIERDLAWAKKRKAEKPWYPDNDSPRLMLTCNAYISLLEEVKEHRSRRQEG